MPRDVVALVSADDFVSAVRVYADRVNDLLRRNGVPALEAIDVSETEALALLDAVVNAPETVVDLAGWWFARSIEFTAQSERVAAIEVDQPVSMLAGTAGEEQVRAALSTLSDGERAAVVLRDGYDLPPQAVGVALRRGAESAAELTASGRLHLVAAYDGRRVPDLSGHSGRTTVDVLSLSRLAEGTLESPRAAPLRRHAVNCEACENVLEALARGRRLAAGLPIIAMDDDARESLIERISERAAAVLPTHDAVLRAVDEDHDPGPLISPVLAVFVLVLAITLGVAIAAIDKSDHSTAAAPTPIDTSVPVVTPSFTVSTTPTVHRHRATPTITPTTVLTSSLPVNPTVSQKPTAVVTTPARSVGPATIALNPTKGHSGANITVTGTGWPPNTAVTVTYGDGLNMTTTDVDASGAFTATVTADALLPSQQTIVARDGKKHASAVFNQRL